MNPPRPRLVIFSDDWGRHPSSCQHLARELLGDYEIDWINTIGTRRPSLNMADLRRSLEKLGQWMRSPRRASAPTDGLRIHSPIMWPSFHSRPARALNARLLNHALRRVLPGERPPAAVVTTIPLVADLARRHAHLNWLYYCVDALADWPGLDGHALQRMERDLLEVVPRVVVVSETLREHVRTLGREAELLTHGVDPEAWKLPPREPHPGRPRLLYWGSIDVRLDPAACLALAEVGELEMVGPLSWIHPALLEHPHIHLRGPVPIGELRDLAAKTDVLVMPYADLPVTRAMQPLKLKEYLATGLPVLAPPLPAIHEWRDALDLCTEPIRYASFALERCGAPLPPAQIRARERLAAESWRAKSARFRQLMDEGERTVLHTRIVARRGGGPEKTIMASPRFLVGSNYRALTAYLHDPRDPDFPQIRAQAERELCPLSAIPDRHPLDLRVLRHLARICRTERVRLWHGHEYKSNLLGLLLRRRLGLHLVTTVHGWIPGGPRTRLYHAIDRWCLRRYDRVIVVSTDLLERCRACGVPPERLRLVENAIDTEAFRRTRPPAAARNGAQHPDRLVIGAVGRLSAEKGFDLLVRAVARLLDEGLDLELWIAGEGPQRAELSEAIRSTGHAERMRLLGFRNDVREVFESFDLFALSSFTEALPNCLLEAMAMEVPVVATRTGGVPGLLGDGDAGRLCEPRSEKALTAELRRLVRDPELRARLATAGRQRVVEHHGFAVRMARVRAIYDELAGASWLWSP